MLDFQLPKVFAEPHKQLDRDCLIIAPRELLSESSGLALNTNTPRSAPWSINFAPSVYLYSREKVLVAVAVIGINLYEAV